VTIRGSLSQAGSCPRILRLPSSSNSNSKSTSSSTADTAKSRGGGSKTSLLDMGVRLPGWINGLARTPTHIMGTTALPAHPETTLDLQVVFPRLSTSAT
jgi:hypothetical protein